MARQKGKVIIDPNDIVGKQFGDLTVLKYAGHYVDKTDGGERLRHMYFCRCKCGVCKYIRRTQLKNNLTKSCGCTRRKQITWASK